MGITKASPGSFYQFYALHGTCVILRTGYDRASRWTELGTGALVCNTHVLGLIEISTLCKNPTMQPSNYFLQSDSPKGMVGTDRADGACTGINKFLNEVHIDWIYIQDGIYIHSCK
jgi:hypothetical protein